MRISDVSIRNPVFAWMLMAAFILFGWIGFSRLGVSQLPDADFPVLNVSVNLEGAAPEVMETTVVDPIEDSLMSVEGVRQVNSSSKPGQANISIEFELGRDINASLQEVQAKLAQIQRLLPRDIDPPIITKTNPDDQPIIWLALTYDKNDTRFLMKFARDYVKDRFTTIPGVGDLFLGGYTDPALRLWVKSNELYKNNIAVTDIIDAVRNEHIEIPGGNIEKENKSVNVRTMGEAHSVPDFKNIIITHRVGQVVTSSDQGKKLQDLAIIEEGLDDQKRISRFNGIEAIGIGVRKQRGSNAVEVARQVKAKVAEIQSTLPPGMKLNVNFDSTQFIENSVRELNKHLLLAALLTALVCWMFLGSWSATLNVLLSIPTSVMGTFMVLYFLNFTMNTFTLLGLTLSIGIIVDDAIMVLENIFRYRELGKGRIDAAIIGAREITFAAMAATLAVVAIFLPVAFMKGVIGKFFMQFGVTISVAVLLSLLESLTITPMRCSEFVQISERTTKIGKLFENLMGWIERTYTRTIKTTLGNSWWVLGGSILFLVASFSLLKFIDKEFMPVQDQSIFLMRLQTPTGSSLQFTNEKTKLVEAWLRGRPEIRQVYVSVGGFSGGASDTNTAMAFVTMKLPSDRGIDPKSDKIMTQQDFMEFSRKELAGIKDLRVMMQDLSMRGFTASRGFPVEMNLLGPDWEELHQIADKIMAKMNQTGMMTDVDSNYLLGMPELQITPNRNSAALHGVSISNIGTTVNALIGGVKIGQYPEGGHRYDIKLKLYNPEQKDLIDQVPKLLIGNARGNLIPLSQVTKQEIKPTLQQISRVNRSRAISITAGLKPGMSQEKAVETVEMISQEFLKPGYQLVQAGSSKSFKESFDGLRFALLMGLLVAYMILAAQFNSYLDPVSILMALPFSLSGAFIALKLTHQSLNIYSFIGLLLLMGIVKKNSILLIEFTNSVRDSEGLDARTALEKACPIRLRPILMTSVATIAGALPSALAHGEGSETSRPMAAAIIGGVLVSTVLTLVVVPSVYLLFEKLRRRSVAVKEIEEAFKRVG